MLEEKSGISRTRARRTNVARRPSSPYGTCQSSRSLVNSDVVSSGPSDGYDRRRCPVRVHYVCRASAIGSHAYRGSNSRLDSCVARRRFVNPCRATLSAKSCESRNRKSVEIPTIPYSLYASEEIVRRLTEARSTRSEAFLQKYASVRLLPICGFLFQDFLVGL